MPVAGGEDEVAALAVVARREHRLHALALAQRQDVDERATARGARGLGQVVDARAVDLAAVGEEQQVVVGRADEQVLDEVAVLHVHAADAAAAAVLLAVGVQRQRLDVAGVGDRDHHLLVGDQVLDVDLALGVDDLGAPLVAEALADLEQLLLDDREHAQLVAEDRAQLADPLERVGVLALDLAGLERGQLREAQVEDRLGLDHATARSARPAGCARSRGRRRRGSARSPRRGARARSAGPRARARAPRAGTSSCLVRRTITSRWCST